MLVFLCGMGALGGDASIACGAHDTPQFFPIGLYSVNSSSPYSNSVIKEFPEIAAAGFNVIQSYQFEGDIEGPANTLEDARTYLDAAQKSGLKVLMGIPQECVKKKNLACVQKRVSALKDHRALFGWQLYDEPDSPVYDPVAKKEGAPVSPKNLIEVYKAIKRLDPDHPVSIASYLEIDEKYPYLNCFDIFMSEYLPIPAEPPTAAIVPYTDAAVRMLTPRGKTVMSHVQVYNLKKDELMVRSGAAESERGHQAQGRYPTREEIRFMAYYGLFRGTKGIFFNSYRFDYGEGLPGDDISRIKNPSQWRAVSSVSAELKAMLPILLAPTQTPARAGVTVAGKAAVEMMLKQHGGKTYLLAVNPSQSSFQLQVRLALDRFPSPKIVLLPEGRRITFQNGSFNSQWGPYDVHVYEISQTEVVNK